MKNNVGGTIDDLLEDVDQALLAGYAQKHGRSLKWANAAYKMVCRDRDALRRKGSILFWSWVAGILVIACYAPAAILELLGLVTLMILWQVLVLRTYKENADAATEYQRMLAEFRAAVEGLYSEYSVSRIVDEYYVRRTLVDLACRLIKAESSFKVLLNISSSTLLIVRCGEYEMECRKTFESKLQAVAEFGLVFKKAELFRDAAAILDH